MVGRFDGLLPEHDEIEYMWLNLLCGHGEQGGDAKGDSSRHCIRVEPEAHLVRRNMSRCMRRNVSRNEDEGKYEEKY